MKLRKIDSTPEYETRLAKMRDVEYQIFAEVRTGICLPDKMDYKIRICVGELEWTSKMPVQGIKQKMHYFNRWNFRVCETFKSPHASMSNFPLVYIYLIDPTKDKDVPICYWKDYCTNYTDKRAKP
jgi:hypothetical protein